MFASRCSITGSSLGTSSSCTCAITTELSRHIRRIEQAEIEQVRKRGLPPLFHQRGQATLPDLFISDVFISSFMYAADHLGPWRFNCWTAGRIFSDQTSGVIGPTCLSRIMPP